MMPAAKHGDPQLGIDIHLCVVPPSPSPVPLPTPHISAVFDPFDYLPIIGATVTVCGMKRATAGTNGMAVHIPPGFPFAPKLPDKDDELFMGSSTVVADGDPFSYIALPVLSCQVAGMMSPIRPKKKGGPMLGVLPTVFNLAIPTTVFVGGPPTISLIGMAFKAAFKGLGKLAKSGVFKRIRQRVFKNMKPGFLKCLVLRAEPVNILTGAVSVEQEDFTLPGRIPIQWVRSYTSSNERAGVCGYGWESPADGRLEIDGSDGSVLMQYPTVGPLSFSRLPVAEGEDAGELELMDGAWLTDDGAEYRVRTKEDRIYHFAKGMTVTRRDGIREIPLVRVSDLCGNWLTFERRSGQFVGIDESAGRRVVADSQDGRITSLTLRVQDGGSHEFVRYEYEAVGNLSAAIDALGHPYRFAYDTRRLTRHTDRNSLSFYYEYAQAPTGDWRVVHSWGDGGLYDYKFGYIDLLNERRITDSLGHVSIVKLDERGLPISEVDPLGGITIFEYDEAGRASAVVDQEGYRTEYAYDDRGNLLTLTQQDGKTVQTAFGALNKPIAITDPNGATWQQRWDTRGLLVEQLTPLGNVSSYEYDGWGQLITVVNARGASTRLEFDDLGNLSLLHDGLGNVFRFTYDLLSNVSSDTDPLGLETLYSYDAKGRLTDVQLPSGATIRYSYDAEDNLTGYVDEKGAETRLEYSGLGEVKSRLQPDGHRVEYEYDTEERLVAVINQRGELYRLNRDPLGRIVEEMDYWGETQRYTYKPNGHLKSSTDPLGRAINYVTDSLGRILQKRLPGEIVESFSYDANGNVVKAGNPHGLIERRFDSENHLVEEMQGTFVIKNVYDANGNRVVRETSFGNVVAYEFDALDQVVLVRLNQEEAIRIERDAAGRIIREALSSRLSRRFGYNADGWLTEQAVTVEKAPLFKTDFDYDRTGNLTRRHDSKYGSDLYGHDPLGRITRHMDPQGRVTRYLNDPAGDRLMTRVVERARQQVVGAALVDTDWSREGEYEGIYYRFDRAGNLVEQRGSDRHLHLAWDANQRLVQSDASGTVTRFGYDPLGRRLFKETNGKRTQFFWDGDLLVGESVLDIRADNRATVALDRRVVDLAEARRGATEKGYRALREYVHYPDTFEPLCVVDDDGRGRSVYYYHNDPNGCPTRLTDKYGDAKWAASYQPWGAISVLYVDTVDNPVRFQNQYADAETGLFYNRARYYAPSLGSFVSQDPTGLFAGVNLYAYAPNTWAWIDPLGLNCAHLSNKAVAKKAKWVKARQGVEGPGLRGHFGKHGDHVNAQTAKAYDRSARETISEGRRFSYRDRASGEVRVGYWNPSTGLFTATSQTRKNPALLSHFPETWENLRKLPGFSHG